MVVLEERLKAAALVLQELQSFLLQQAGDVAQGQAAWRREEEEEEEGSDKVT